MHRRRAVSLLLAAPVLASERRNLDRFLDPRRGRALLLDIHTRQIIASNGKAGPQLLVPPGSTLKPFTLTALLRAGRLRRDTEFACPLKLTLGGRRFDCSHPPLGTPIRIDTAIAYSCNCFVAHAAAALPPGDLARGLRTFGFDAMPRAGEQQQIQAIGDAGLQVTPEIVAHAFAQLASHPEPEVLAGLEGAVDYGTAQLAAVHWAKLAGKTGSTSTGTQFIGWFAGFVSGEVVTVMLAGRHGGSDAAPVAAQILNAWHEGRI